MKKIISMIIALFLFAGINVFAVDQDIVDIASGSEDFTILVAALTEAGLVETLQGEGPFTVFAPTDAAFEDLLADLGVSASYLLGHPQLAEILTFHVVSGKVMSTDLTDGMVAPTVNGESITFDLSDGVKVNGATVTTADVEASNGVIHIIDKVLIPSDFELYPTVVDIAVNNEGFSTLVAALTKAGLVSALQAEGPFTVFAPTNAAFEDLLEALGITAEQLLAQPDLAKVLLFHVISGKVMSTDLVDEMTATTLNGESVTFTEGSWFVQDAEIIAVDIEAGNGVVHVINKVIIPTNFNYVAPEELPDTSDNNALGFAFIALMAGLGLAVVSSKKRLAKQS